MFHWKEEAHHAFLDALEWPREDSKLSAEERDRAIDELIAIVSDIDGILQHQSTADANYLLKVCDRSFTDDEIRQLKEAVLRAYRWHYVFSGVGHPRFKALLERLTTEKQRQHISAALATLN